MSKTQTRRPALLAIGLALLAACGLLVCVATDPAPAPTTASEPTQPARTPQRTAKAQGDTGADELIEAEVRNRLLDELEAEVDAALKGRHVRCPVPGVPPGTKGLFMDEAPLPSPTSVQTRDGLFLVTDQDQGAGQLKLVGYKETSLSWASNAEGFRVCTVGPLEAVPVFMVRGLVLTASGDPAPAAQVQGCGLDLVADALRRFESERIENRLCILTAFGGPLGADVAEEVLQGGDGDRELELQAQELAVMGAVVFPRGDYWVVPEVLPGSPAEEAGMEAQDEILSVNGTLVHGYTPAELLLGSVGHELELGLADETTALVTLAPAAAIYREAGMSEEQIQDALESRWVGWNY